MDAPQILRHMVASSGKSYRQIARELGRSESFISATIAQGSCPRLDTFAGIAKACGYPNAVSVDNFEDLDKELLVSYSNGYGPYVLPIGFKYITYEMFTDTLTEGSKKRIISTLQNI